MSVVVERGGNPRTGRGAGFHHLREHLYWALPVALLPLAFSLGRPADDAPDRFRQTLAFAPAEIRRAVEAVELDPDATLDDLLAALPDCRIQGALLPRDTGRHWLFAALAAVAFLGFTASLFPEGRASSASLVGVGLFTATAGAVVLLAVQKVIAPTCRAVLDGDGDFLLSLCGYVLAVGLVEEAAKALPLLWRAKRAGVPDWRTACLWGLASGVGFGVAEGVYHAERAYNGLATADTYLVRFASCVALHAVWSASVGMTMVTAGRRLGDTLEPAAYAATVLRVLASPAALHGLYDVLLLYHHHAAALGAAAASFGWLGWQIEMARRGDVSPRGETRAYPSNSPANDRRNGSASLTIPTV